MIFDPKLFCFILKNKARSARRTVYTALEIIEEHGHEKVERFWECVDQDHILEKYHQFSELLTMLKTSQVVKTDVETRRSQNNNERNQAEPSSQSTNSQTTAERVKSSEFTEQNTLSHFYLITRHTAIVCVYQHNCKLYWPILR